MVAQEMKLSQSLLIAIILAVAMKESGKHTDARYPDYPNGRRISGGNPMNQLFYLRIATGFSKCLFFG